MRQNLTVLNKTILLLLVSALFFSCKTAKKQEPLTAAEAKDFARQLQSSVERRESDFFNEAIDKDIFLKKIGLNQNGSDGKAFTSGILSKLNIGTQLTGSISKKATYQLVKQYEKDNKQHLIFRLYDNGSLNYHDLELTKTDKKVKVADLFIYTSGELLSETLHNLFLQMKQVMNKDEMEDADWIDKMPRMRTKLNTGDYEGAMRDFETLPEKIKNLRALALMKIMITSGLTDESKYSEAIENYQQKFPNEPNMHLVLIDGYIMKKEYDKALQSVNKMDEMINKDPFLDYYRYLISTLLNDKSNAKKYLIQVTNNFPDFEEGLLELIITYREDGETQKADSLIKEYRIHSGFDQESLKMVINE